MKTSCEPYWEFEKRRRRSANRWQLSLQNESRDGTAFGSTSSEFEDIKMTRVL